MFEAEPRHVVAIVCSTCGEPWDNHVTLAEGERVSLMQCVTLLKERNMGPPGPQGPTGPKGDMRYTYRIDPARTNDPPEALRSFLTWLWEESYLYRKEVATDDFERILREYWGSP